ncbi:hypothetical protein BDW75DRAFT_214415 [Aspergillus navahoensis]
MVGEQVSKCQPASSDPFRSSYGWLYSNNWRIQSARAGLPSSSSSFSLVAVVCPYCILGSFFFKFDGEPCGGYSFASLSLMRSRYASAIA